MRSDCGIYPALGDYFETVKEIADAACMSPRQLEYCLKGEKVLTDQQKRAIANEIVARMVNKEIDSYKMLLILEARKDFDKIFRKNAA